MTNQAYDMNDLAEMLAGRALGDLSEREAAELDRLSIAHGDSDEFDLLAARLDLALAGDAPAEPVPASLSAALEDAAERFLDERSSEPAPVAGRVEPAGSSGVIASLGWIAAAACLLLAALAWFQVPAATAPPTFDAVAARPAALTLPLAAGDSAVGELVWDGRSQTGVMRFTGLDSNDPTVEQYQLWIFDASRGQFTESPLEIDHPVDGGVFDIPAGQDAVEVPINAKIPVGQPVLFAVTVEPPGGVVVSDRSRIAAVGVPG